MAPNADPWRTLGLTPGATQDEVRRAYRRLAKINHPDAAGDGALPRFLAIQAAYEQLAGPGRIRRVGARPATRPTDPGAAEREPWRADPDRARASGRADGRRTPGARPTRPSGGTGPSAPGARAGARGEAGDSSAGDGPSAAGADAPGSGSGSGSRSSAGAGRRGGPGPGSGSARARRAPGRRSPPNTATPGSTSYEGAEEEPFEPGWSGATWYGASSGTYWTINPKEYADPRKHGPEYQARARRAAGAAPDEGGPVSDERTGDPAGPPAPEPGPTPEPGPEAPPRPVAGDWTRKRAGGTRHWPDAPPPEATAPSPRATSVGNRASGPAATSGEASAGADWKPRGPFRTPGDPAREGSRPSQGPAADGASGAAGPGGGGPPARGLRSWVEEPAGGEGFRGPTLRRPTTPAGRLAMALLGWAPLGVFATAAIDQSTGCGRYAASCPEVSAPGTWILQAAIVLLLLAVPAVAAWSAHGAIAALVAGVPSAIVLSAAGGTNVRETSGPLLLGVLAVAYIAGVAYAVLVRRRVAPA